MFRRADRRKVHRFKAVLRIYEVQEVESAISYPLSSSQSSPVSL